MDNKEQEDLQKHGWTSTAIACLFFLGIAAGMLIGTFLSKFPDKKQHEDKGVRIVRSLTDTGDYEVQIWRQTPHWQTLITFTNLAQARAHKELLLRVGTDPEVVE